MPKDNQLDIAQTCRQPAVMGSTRRVTTHVDPTPLRDCNSGCFEYIQNQSA